MFLLTYLNNTQLYSTELSAAQAMASWLFKRMGIYSYGRWGEDFLLKPAFKEAFQQERYLDCVKLWNASYFNHGALIDIQEANIDKQFEPTY